MAEPNSLPDGWELKKIGDACIVNPSRSEVRDYPDDLEVTFVPMAAADEGVGAIVAPEARRLGEVRKGYTYFREGDVLFAKITPCMENGKAAVAHGLSNGIGFGSTEFHVLRPKEELLPEWLFFWIRRPPFREEAAANFTGSVGQQRVPPSFLSEVEIPLPPLEEQRRIVARIEELAGRIEEAKGLRRAAREQAEALLPAASAEVFENDQWPRVPVREVLSGVLRNGRSVRPTTQSADVGCLTLGSMRDGRVDCGQVKPVPLKPEEAEPYLVREGDVFIVRGSGGRDLVARAGLVEEVSPGIVFPDLLIRVPLDSTKVMRSFFVEVWNSKPMRDEIEQTAKTTSGIWKINQGHIKSLSIPVPPMSEQHEIIGYLDGVRAKADELRRLQEETQRELEALLPSVLERAFRGEL